MTTILGKPKIEIIRPNNVEISKYGDTLKGFIFKITSGIDTADYDTGYAVDDGSGGYTEVIVTEVTDYASNYSSIFPDYTNYGMAFRLKLYGVTKQNKNGDDILIEPDETKCNVFTSYNNDYRYDYPNDDLVIRPNELLFSDPNTGLPQDYNLFSVYTDPNLTNQILPDANGLYSLDFTGDIYVLFNLVYTDRDGSLSDLVTNPGRTASYYKINIGYYNIDAGILDKVRPGDMKFEFGIKYFSLS